MKVLITYRKTCGVSTVSAVVLGYGGKVTHEYKLAPVLAADVPDTAVAALRATIGIEKVEEDKADVQTCDGAAVVVVPSPSQTAPWGVVKIRAPEVHAEGTTGVNAKLAILDTGGDFTHPDLAPTYGGGWNFITNTPDPHNDVHSHGTHCWGIAAAAKNNLGIYGVAPNASVFVFKVLNDQGQGQWSHIAAAVERCVVEGIDIASMSLGGNSDPGTAIASIFQAAADAGLIMFAAAGNRGTASGEVDWPARFPGCIAVAATDEADLVASFSSRGAKVEVAAPGVSVNSTIPGGGYGIKSGTSMATPHAAGGAALMLSAGVAKAEVRARLQRTSIDLGSPGRDVETGFGRIDAWRAVHDVPPPAPEPPISGPIVTVDASRSFDPEGATLTYAWQAQGQSAQGINHTFNFPVSGPVDIDLTVTDDRGASATRRRQVIIQAAPNMPPIAVITHDVPLTGPVPWTVNLSGLTSTDPDGTIAGYRWYQSGLPAGITTPTLRVLLASAGSLRIGLVVVDNAGAESPMVEVTVTATAANQPPVADFTINGA